MFIENYGIFCSIRFHQAKCLEGYQVKNFCNKNNTDIIEALVIYHQTIGPVERPIHTIKNRLACIEEEKSAINLFHKKHELKSIFHQLRMCKQNRREILSSKHTLAESLIPS